MGLSCGCSNVREGSSTEMVSYSVELFDALGVGQNRLVVNTNPPQTIDPDLSPCTNRLYGKDIQIESPKKPDASRGQLAVKHSANLFLLDQTDERITYPMTYVGKKDDGNDEMTKNSNSSQGKKQVRNIPAATDDRKIATVLRWLMISEDEEIKAIAKKMYSEVVLPTASTAAINEHRARKTRCWALPEQLLAPNFERSTVYGLIDGERKSMHPKPNHNINDDNVSLESYPSELYAVDEKQSKMNLEPPSTAASLNDIIGAEKSTAEPLDTFEIREMLEYSELRLEETRRKSARFCERVRNMSSFSKTLSMISSTRGISCESSDMLRNSIFSVTESSFEGEEEITLPTYENDLPYLRWEKLEMIARHIDTIEQKINETRTKIRQLRGESVNILITETTDLEVDCDPDSVRGAHSYLEIEKNIRRLEVESHELENKRRDAVSKLQNKMLVNILGTEMKKLPLVSIPMSEGHSVSMLPESQTTRTSFDGPTTEGSKISLLPTFSETARSEVEEHPKGRVLLC